MYKISNALAFDDKINLLIQSNDIIQQGDFSEYNSLKVIQNFFLNNSIPFSVINNIADSPIDAIEKIKNISKPDLVVLDLDLNSNGEVDDTDISILSVILKELVANFGEFIILIYSSEADNWEEVKNSIIELEESLKDLLDSENVIVLKKVQKSDGNFNEALSAEIINKEIRYFSNQIALVESVAKTMWNKEVKIILFFLVTYQIFVKFTFSDSDYLFVAALIIMILVTVFFVYKNPSIKNEKTDC